MASHQSVGWVFTLKFVVGEEIHTPTKQVDRGRPTLYLVKDVRILCGLGIPILSLVVTHAGRWEPGPAGLSCTDNPV